jgi:hypothetical protein
MSKRISKTVTLALVLATCIAFLFIMPAQACEPPKPPPPPKVEIWKKFLSTSDPPPYTMGIEYHWDIEIGVSTEVDLYDAKVSDNFGAELKIDHITTPTKTYTFTYLDYESKYPTTLAKVNISDGTTITHKLDWIGVTFGSKPYKFHIDWSGTTHKVHFEWYIGELKAGKTITVTIGISTDLNPGGKQEFTSTCEHCINSGAVVKAIWRDRCRCRCISAESEQLYVKVQCEVPHPAKLILDKFNDTDGNGIYDDGDFKISNWKIDVKDPDGITTTYLTPTTIDITNFGTYTTTEELPGVWEQTALRVDGVYLAPAVTTSVLVSEGDTHEVLYGNKLPCAPPKARLVIQKFNDTNNNGIYEPATDPLITWTVYVKDPDGITTTYTTPVDLVITNFGTYTITEDLPSKWLQTAVYVDGVPATPPTLTVTVAINSGETHKVLYGNFKIPRPPPIGIWMSINPISQRVGSNIIFSWKVLTIRPDVMPQKVELRLKKPDGTSFILYTATNFPTDYEGAYTWTSTLPTGTWWIYITYTYTYYGTTYTAGTLGSFMVTS